MLAVTNLELHLICANLQQIKWETYLHNNYVHIKFQAAAIIHKLYKSSPFKYTCKGSVEKFGMDFGMMNMTDSVTFCVLLFLLWGTKDKINL